MEESQSEIERPPGNDAAVPPRRNLRAYLASHIGWYGAIGIQMVLFPYLAAVVLDLPARFIGLAQLALMGPGLFLMLPGGALADQVDERSHLIRMHFLAAIPPLLMSVVLFFNQLSYPILLTYAVMAGSCTAFATPTRDALLSRMVIPGKLQSAVAAASLTQFAGMMVGMALASSAGQIGPASFVAIHGLLMISGGIAIMFISGPTIRPDRGRARMGLAWQWHQAKDAFAEIKKSRILLPVLSCNLAVGVFFVGAFLVVVPVSVRDIYDGGAAQIALLFLTFWAGTIASSSVILRRGGIRRRGRLMFGALCLGTTILALMALPMSFWALEVMMFGWGIGGGIVITTGRIVVQEEAKESHRARILAVFQMGFMGGGPLGALAVGFAVDGVGPQLAVLVPAAGMAIFLVWVYFGTHLWRLSAARTE